MAHISQCLVCGEQTVNSSYCPECVSAPYNDLLARIQEEVRKNPKKTTSGKTCERNFGRSFQNERCFSEGKKKK